MPGPPMVPVIGTPNGIALVVVNGRLPLASTFVSNTAATPLMYTVVTFVPVGKPSSNFAYQENIPTRYRRVQRDGAELHV
jgi:hypothetical protein